MIETGLREKGRVVYGGWEMDNKNVREGDAFCSVWWIVLACPLYIVGDHSKVKRGPTFYEPLPFWITTLHCMSPLNASKAPFLSRLTEYSPYFYMNSALLCPLPLLFYFSF